MLVVEKNVGVTRKISFLNLLKKSTRLSQKRVSPPLYPELAYNLEI